METFHKRQFIIESIQSFVFQWTFVSNELMNIIRENDIFLSNIWNG